MYLQVRCLESELASASSSANHQEEDHIYEEPPEQEVYRCLHSY